MKLPTRLEIQSHECKNTKKKFVLRKLTIICRKSSKINIIIFTRLESQEELSRIIFIVRI